MLQLIETICFKKGSFQRIPLHEERLNRSRNHFLGMVEPLFLTPLLKIPELMKNEKVRCRITYAMDIESIEYELYNVREIRSLKLVFDDAIDYSYKYKQRDSLNALLSLRGNADEILVVKSGLITDTSFTNVVLLKEGVWYTPATPLLPGTRREHYLRHHQIIPIDIKPAALPLFEEARLINAMRSIEDSAPIPIAQILI
jgi:4-amino-4-deoxychorismate lyase